MVGGTIGIAIQSQVSLSRCLAIGRSRSLSRGESSECLRRSRKRNGRKTGVQETQNQAIQQRRDSARPCAELLTCNCRHIANAHMLPRVYDLLADFGLPRLLICTPAEFLGDPADAP